MKLEDYAAAREDENKVILRGFDTSPNDLSYVFGYAKAASNLPLLSFFCYF